MIEIDLIKLNKKANEFISNGEIDKGIDIFKSVLIIDPNYFKSLFNLGVVYQKEKEFSRATDYYIRALEIKKNDRNTVINLVHALVQVQDYKRAINYLKSFLSEIPNDSEISSFLTYIIDLSSKQNNRKMTNFSEVKSSSKELNKLKILFIQDSPCIRNYKYATALKKAGHIVDLYYTERSLRE